MNKQICCIKECEKPVSALGLCVNHWRRNRKYGSPVAIQSHSGQFRGLDAPTRFGMQIKKTDSCWTWVGGKDKNGYGIFKGEVAGVLFNKAHRYSYALHTGDLLIDKQALHSCDNPSCVNPDHLSSGTNADNMKDKALKGRSRVPLGEKNPHAVLSDEQATLILADPRTYTKIAADYNVAASIVGSLKQRHSWKHLTGTVVKHERIGKRGEKSYAAKVTAEDVLAIRASSESGKVLALKYGISPQSVTDMRKFRSWKYI